MEKVEYQKMEFLEKNHWWFLAKRKFLKVVLSRNISANNDLRKKMRVLDIGCGTGAVMNFLMQEGFENSVGVDMSDEALFFCEKKGLSVQKAFANNLPFPTDYFDLIVALDVLEHIENDEEALKEISRVLKKDGLFISTVPAHQMLWSYHDVALHHVRRYDRNSFEKKLSSDFKIITISWIHFFILFPAAAVRLVESFFSKTNRRSDVKRENEFLNHLMLIIYSLEISFFKIFNFLTWGLSLLGVVTKK
jgi:SAM-dependent methyltransferase